ncbi:MAG: hypothetical protein GY832_35455 [Chloroflexi bacterium]|nr:hypothetical protein [Chloroflexota bacterium]
MVIEFHEIANIFPLMQAEEYAALKADIEVHGLRETIWLHPDGRIIDGRNRYRACTETGVTPRFRTWDGQGSLVAFVVSLNLHRRHLSSGQRAVLAVEVLPMLEDEARKRQLATLKWGNESPVQELFPEREDQGQARDHAADLTGTNPRYVSDAKKLKQTAPDVFSKVVSGTVSLPEAKKLSRLPEQVQLTILEKIEQGEARTVKQAHRQIKDAAIAEVMANPTRSETGDCIVITGDARCLDVGLFDGKRYGVIIADPPWPYDNPKDHNPRMGGYTYQPMTLDEIKAMPVQALATDNAILFLWGTWPKLPQVVEVISAWGFEHVTDFPWVKTAQNGAPVYGIGSWVAGCSEYVLIGRRGHVSPPDEKYLGLVGPSLGHSRKPDSVHAIVETLLGPYLELFARRTRSGWTVFGNDVGDIDQE